jgi:alpha-mannosidase
MTSPAEPKRSVTVYCIGNAHIDPVWLWPWSDGLDAALTTYSSALERISETPHFRFTCSAAATYLWLQESSPEVFECLRRAVTAGQWEIVAGWWVQSDCNIPGGECLIRQGLYGQHYFQHVLGRRAEVGYNVDSFGHAATLPQILRGCGLRAYVFCRPDRGQKSLPSDVFWWEAPGGKRVLAIRPPNHYGAGESGAETMRARLREAIERCPRELEAVVCMYGVGNHGGGPTRAQIDAILHPGSELDGHRIRFATLADYIEALGDTTAGLPVVAEELQHHARGGYTAHSGMKSWTRRAEHMLIRAERFAVLGRLLCGRDYPREDFRRAWQALLFSQFHDTLAGTAIAEAYPEARDAFGFVAHVAAQHTHLSARRLADRIDTRGEGQALVVFNSLPWARRSLVAVEGRAWGFAPEVLDAHGSPVAAQPSGRLLIFHAEVPALGYRLYRVRRAGAAARPEPPTRLSRGEDWIENEFWRVELDRETGQLASIRDSRTGAEYLSARARVTVLRDPSDTWSHGVRDYRDEAGDFRASRIVGSEHGPVRSALSVVSRFGDSKLIQDHMLESGSPLIAIRFRLHYRGRHQAIKWTLTPKLRQPTYTWEAPYGHITRPPDNGEDPMQRWVDITGVLGGGIHGVTVFNDGKSGADVLDGALRITILRSPIYAFHAPRKPDPNENYRYLDQGEQEFTIWILPHEGPWQEAAVGRRAQELHDPLLPVVAASHGGPWGSEASWMEVEPQNLVVPVLKFSEDDETVVLRGYDSVGKQTRARIRLPLLDAEWTGEVEAHEIFTLRQSDGALFAANMLEEACP